jgi:hypothetical protein
MDIVMKITGGLAVLAGLFELVIFAVDTSGLRYLYIFMAASTLLTGILYLGFGSVLTQLQQLVDNTKSLHEFFENAKARLPPSGGTSNA